MTQYGQNRSINNSRLTAGETLKTAIQCGRSPATKPENTKQLAGASRVERKVRQTHYGKVGMYFPPTDFERIMAGHLI
jgi:hypothetical protein